MIFFKKKPENQDYGKTVKEDAIKDLKNKRKQLMADMITTSSTVMKEVQKFNNQEKIQKISFDEMYELELEKWYDINQGVKTKPIFKSPKRIIFQVEMKRNHGFSEHLHYDCKEQVEIVKGCLVDAVTGLNYKEGQHVYYTEGHLHQPFALEDSFLLVTFIR